MSADADLVPEQALDYTEILRRGGKNLGDQGITSWTKA
jgi:hypothetical protein